MQPITDFITSYPVVFFSVIGALLGYAAKAITDVWTNKAKWHQDFRTHFIGEIEKAVPSYYLMSNYAGLLSLTLGRYVEIKRQLQITPREQLSPTPYDVLDSQREEAAKAAMFYAVKLYGVIHDRFWVVGGQYLLPDKWADEAITHLHNDLMEVIAIDPNVLLKHIKADTQEHEFYETLKISEDDDDFEDLRNAYNKYKEWILRQDEAVNKASAYARAYSNLFDQQMYRLYKDWYERGWWRKWRALWRKWWQKPLNDPREALEVRRESSPLRDETSELIKRSADKYNRQQQKRTDLSEVTARSEVREPNAYLNLGWNHYIDGAYDIAIREYKKVVEEYEKAVNKKLAYNPIVPRAYNNLGNAHASKADTSKKSRKSYMHDYKQAAQMYEQATKLEPSNATFHANFGLMCLNKGDYEEAVQHYEQAIKQDASDPVYHNGLGRAYTHSKKWHEAIRAFGRAIVSSPSTPVLYMDLAYSYENQGWPIAAIETYRTAEELATDTDNKAYCWEEVGKIYEKLGRLQEARDAYYQAQECDKSRQYLLIYYLSGERYYNAGDYERALYEYDKAVRLAPKKADYHYRLGRTYGELGHWEMAVRSYEKALEIADDKPAIYHYHRGLACRNIGLYDEALTSLQRAVDRKPTEFYFLLDLARVDLARAHPHASQPDLQEALLDRLVEVHREAFKKEPNQPELYLKVGRIYEWQDDYQGAISAYRRAIDLAPDNPIYQAYLHNVLGNTYHEEQNWRSAIQEWEQALRAAPDDSAEIFNPALVHKKLGSAYDELGEEDKVLQHYEQATRIVPDDFEAFYDIGVFHFRRERIQHALREWQEALRLIELKLREIQETEQYSGYISNELQWWRLSLKNVDITYNTGNCYYRMQYTDLAEEKWREAVTLDPRLIEAYYNLGIVSFEQGNKDRAKQYWQETLEINPQFEPAQQILETLQQERSPDLELYDIR